MAAARKDITIERGATLTLKFLLQYTATSGPFDLTGYTATAQVRETPTGKHTLAVLSCVIPTPATNGEIDITLDNVTSAALKSGTFSWDLFITNGPQVIRLLFGRTIVVDTTTR